MTVNLALVKQYADLIRPHLELAKKAYGDRNTQSPQHDASREYTRLLKEFYEQGGSLLALGEELGVQYSGLRRRITAQAPDPDKAPRKRVKVSEEELNAAAADLLALKGGDSEVYHDRIKHYYDANVSLSKLAEKMGLASAYTLYYGKDRAESRAAAALESSTGL